MKKLNQNCVYLKTLPNCGLPQFSLYLCALASKMLVECAEIYSTEDRCSIFDEHEDYLLTYFLT